MCQISDSLSRYTYIDIMTHNNMSDDIRDVPCNVWRILRPHKQRWIRIF